MSKRYTAAIVGCGSIGHAHAEGYRLAGVDIVAVTDPVAEARRQYIHQYGPLREYASVHELLAESPPDLVSVCTWHRLHPEPVIAAGDAGIKGVICEKPMAVCMADADRMVKACDGGGTPGSWSATSAASRAAGSAPGSWCRKGHRQAPHRRQQGRPRAVELRHPHHRRGALRPRGSRPGLGDGGGRAPHRPPRAQHAD